MLRVGLDVGSTTLKCAVTDENGNLIYRQYRRHFSQITERVTKMLDDIIASFPSENKIKLCISGSAGMGFAQEIGIPFVQEVYATRNAVSMYLPQTDVVIELGGEDAKILFLTDSVEVRMNGSCAGGTGAFIDQMSTLLAITPDKLNELAVSHKKIYSIASRCGVFAKSDIQPLLNQGASKEDISASIFYAVANQTVAGLAQGRKIEGNVLYLGGPLTFFSQLRAAFDDTLQLTGICPDNSLYFVSLGAAFNPDGELFDISEIRDRIASHINSGIYNCCEPLFVSQEDYDSFSSKHPLTFKHSSPKGKSFIGIDAGSTTVKAVAINEDEDIFYSEYMPNSGNPVPLVKNFIENLYNLYPDIEIGGSATTGYGEDIVKNAFHADMGIVETIAHYTAARKYEPDVDFIIDIGGQDIKCFKIRRNSIDNIFLNEACSSGCGSFLQTFAGALDYSISDFSKLGLFADKPVDLGSRCTVFMNSSVKQAQKDGASIENISAGLSISVVKNALYKVIRARSGEELGQHIVVQGGTFLNNAVLRAFEKEIGQSVTRPPIAGLMGAYGAALFVKSNKNIKSSTLLSHEELKSFTHEVKAITCHGCTNNCRLTVNTFADGSKFIGGNQCEKPLGNTGKDSGHNLYEYKRSLVAQYGDVSGTRKEIIGIPVGLNMFELIPFWHTFFKELGFGIKLSPKSSKKLYRDGQSTIPSDTVCYPAKLIHGHVASLNADPDVTAIFYPCMSYNFDEGMGDNHFNCPVVAYYPEVVFGNMEISNDKKVIMDYVGPHRQREFPSKMHTILSKYFDGISLSDVSSAAAAARHEYNSYMDKIRICGDEYLKYAFDNSLPVIVLCGRPYHIDTEINHGIDKYIAQRGAVVISEDALASHYHKIPTAVLNQWTYHSRLYEAADFVASYNSPKVNLVQLVSFGCGVDAVTTDEVRRILEEKDKIYTQIKIDEITNLGAVKIRLRSLFAATGENI